MTAALAEAHGSALAHPGTELVDIGFGLPVTIRRVADRAGLQELHAWMSARRSTVLGIDCETNAVNPWAWGYRLRTVQIADGMTAWVVVVEVLDDADRRAFTRMISGHERFVAHYAEADIRFLGRGLPGAVRMGDIVPHIVDTQVVMATYDPRTVTTASKKDSIHPSIPLRRGLKDTSDRLISDALSRAEKDMHARFKAIAPVGHRTPEKSKIYGFAHIANDDPTYMIYGGLDPLYTVLIYRKAVEEIRRRGQWAECETNLITQWHIDMATFRGMPVDPVYARWLDRELTRVVDERTAMLARYDIGVSGQGPAVGKAFKAVGVAQSPVMKRKDGGYVESWDKTAIAQLLDIEKYGFEAAMLASAVSVVRKAGKFRSTYVKPMLEAIDRDGWVHCSMRAIGTVTGRMSARDPALQQLPKKDTRVRAAFRAPVGWAFVSADLSQGEPRTMAALSGDLNYLADLLAGDINTTLAALVYGDVFDPEQGDAEGTEHYLMRQRAKAAWLAWCYGAKPPKVAETLGLPEERGVELVARWANRYPDLAALIRRLNAQTEVVLDSGRICPLWDRWDVDSDGKPYPTKKSSRKGLNYATQGTQRDLLVHALKRLIAAGWIWSLAFLVHDEIILLVPEWMAPQACTALEASMTMTYRGVPIECKAKINGSTWTAQPDEFDPEEIRDDEDLELVGADATRW